MCWCVVRSVLVCAVVLLMVISDTEAKKKLIKIIVPHKIKYIHHHHTHVFVLKAGKDWHPGKGHGHAAGGKHPRKEPEHHHLHYVAEHKPKKVPKKHHHFYLPYSTQQSPHSYEEEESSLTEYVLPHDQDSYFPEELVTSDTRKEFRELDPYFPTRVKSVPSGSRTPNTHRLPITSTPQYDHATYGPGYDTIVYEEPKLFYPSKSHVISVRR